MTLSDVIGRVLGVGEARLNGRSVLGYGANLILSHKFIDFRPEMVVAVFIIKLSIALTQTFYSFT